MTTPRKQRNYFQITETGNMRRLGANRRDARVGTCTFTIEEEGSVVTICMQRKHTTISGRVVHESQKISLTMNERYGLEGWLFKLREGNKLKEVARG